MMKREVQRIIDVLIQATLAQRWAGHYYEEVANDILAERESTAAITYEQAALALLERIAVALEKLVVPLKQQATLATLRGMR
jgi:hypothetical protein